jgi:uncharacterized protein YjbJ (UPF0337 family)
VANPNTPEDTAGGPLGKLAGKAKELTGSALGNDELAREGRLQQAQAEAETDAAQEAAEAEHSTQKASSGGAARCRLILDLAPAYGANTPCASNSSSSVSPRVPFGPES